MREVRTGSCVGAFPKSVLEDSTKIGVGRACIFNLILVVRLNSLLEDYTVHNWKARPGG